MENLQTMQKFIDTMEPVPTGGNLWDLLIPKRPNFHGVTPEIVHQLLRSEGYDELSLRLEHYFQCPILDQQVITFIMKLPLQELVRGIIAVYDLTGNGRSAIYAIVKSCPTWFLWKHKEKIEVILETVFNLKLLKQECELLMLIDYNQRYEWNMEGVILNKIKEWTQTDSTCKNIKGIHSGILRAMDGIARSYGENSIHGYIMVVKLFSVIREAKCAESRVVSWGILELVT